LIPRQGVLSAPIENSKLQTSEKKRLFETALNLATKEICFRVGIGMADWDLDHRLRAAIQSLMTRRRIKNLLRRYDKIVMTAKQLRVPVDSKFEFLFKLRA